MKALHHKPQESSSRSAAHSPPEKQALSREEMPLLDKRVESQVQLKQLEQIQNSPRVTQLSAMQKMIDASLSKVTQLEHKRPEVEEEAPAQLMSKDIPVQRALKASVPHGTKIIIDYENASDVGDVGTIIRNSTKKFKNTDQADPDLKVVEFDNEAGAFYRVSLVEMSAIDPELQRAYGIEKRHYGYADQEATITGEIDLVGGSASFTAYNGAHRVGLLSVEGLDGTLLLKSITTELSPEHRIPGLGALLMNIASMMARHFGKDNITLAAVREGEKHPAPFYKKWGFTTMNEDFNLTEQLGLDFTKYIKENGLEPMTVNMGADTMAVAESTHGYLRGQGWARH